MVSSEVSWVVVGSLLAVLTQTVHSTPAPEARIWKCESEISTYNNSFCNQQGEIPGCYYVEPSGPYQSCAVTCNGVKEHSIDEERCNDQYCPDYLSQDGNCTLVHEVDTTTTAETSTNPTTTSHTVATTTETFTNPTTTNHAVATTAETSTNPTTTNHTIDTTAETSTNATTANHTVDTTTTDRSVISSSSCVVTRVVTGFVCLVIGVALGGIGGVGGAHFYFKRRGQLRRSTPAANAGAHVGNANGEPIRLTVLENHANGEEDANHDETTALNGHANSP